MRPRRPRELAVAAAVATAVTLVAWRTGGWFFALTAEGGEGNLNVARVLLFGAVLGLAYAVPQLVRRAGRLGLLAFAGWTAWLGLWLLGLWPGVVEPDTIEMVVNAREGLIRAWWSWPHATLHLMVLDVVPHIGAMGVLQVLAMATLLAWVTTLLAERSASRLPVTAFVVVGVLSIPLAFYTIHYTRDTAFALLLVTLGLLVARVVVDRRPLTPALLAGLAGLVALLSVMRGDGIVVAFVVPVLLLVALRPDRRSAVAGAAVFAVALLALHVAVPALLTVREEPREYEMTLLMNPLGAVLQSDFASEDRERDLATLGRVLDVERVRELQTPVNIPAYWARAFDPSVSQADWDAFRATARRLMRENVSTVAANRVTTFLASSGLGPGAFRGTEYFGDDAAERVRTVRALDAAQRRALTAEPPVLRLYTVQEDILHWAADFRGVRPTGAALHWNLLPWLAVLVAALLLFRRAPFAAVVALVVISRVPVVVAAAPIAQFKYYNAVHLGGLVVLALLLAAVVPLRLRAPAAAGWLPRARRAGAPQ